MKFLLSGSGLLLFILFSVTQGGLTSCTKDGTIYDTVTVIKKDTVIIKDTVYIKDTAMSAEILTANQWKPMEKRANYGDFALYYLRGNTGVSNQNYDNEYFVFYPNGTGFSNDANNYSHEIKEWKFLNAEKTKLGFKYYITNSSVYHDMIWENIRYKNKNIMHDEYFHDNYVNKNYHGQAVYSPK